MKKLWQTLLTLVIGGPVIGGPENEWSESLEYQQRMERTKFWCEREINVYEQI